MNSDLQIISQGPGGRVLVNKLQATPNIIYVVQRTPGLGNETQGDRSGISVNGKGTGSDVRIDLTQTTGGVDANGNRTRPEYVGLAHELGHARAIDQGVQSYDKGNGTPGTTPPSEVHSMANENMVRKEHNLPIRPSFYDPVPKTPPPPSPPRPNPTNPMKARSIPRLGTALLLLLVSGCATAGEAAWTPSPALVAKVEANLILPAGSQPIGSYGRYYYGRLEHGRRVLVGEFVLEDSSPGVHIIAPADAPRVLDGGCSVVNLVYDPAHKKVTSLFCNGSD